MQEAVDRLHEKVMYPGMSQPVVVAVVSQRPSAERCAPHIRRLHQLQCAGTLLALAVCGLTPCIGMWCGLNVPSPGMSTF